MATIGNITTHAAVPVINAAVTVRIYCMVYICVEKLKTDAIKPINMSSMCNTLLGPHSPIMDLPEHLLRLDGCVPRWDGVDWGSMPCICFQDYLKYSGNPLRLGCCDMPIYRVVERLYACGCEPVANRIVKYMGSVNKTTTVITTPSEATPGNDTSHHDTKTPEATPGNDTSHHDTKTPEATPGNDTSHHDTKTPEETPGNDTKVDTKVDTKTLEVPTEDYENVKMLLAMLRYRKLPTDVFIGDIIKGNVDAETIQFVMSNDYSRYDKPHYHLILGFYDDRFKSHLHKTKQSSTIFQMYIGMKRDVIKPPTDNADVAAVYSRYPAVEKHEIVAVINRTHSKQLKKLVAMKYPAKIAEIDDDYAVGMLSQFVE